MVVLSHGLDSMNSETFFNLIDSAIFQIFSLPDGQITRAVLPSQTLLASPAEPLPLGSTVGLGLF